MWLIGAIGNALLMGALSSAFAIAISSGLSTSVRALVVVAIAGCAVAAGFLVGGSIGYRAHNERHGLFLFAITANGVGGGITGIVSAEAVLSAYLAAYGNWPADIPQQTLYVLAYPVFAALGLFLGAATWSIVGLLVGGAITLTDRFGR